MNWWLAFFWLGAITLAAVIYYLIGVLVLLITAAVSL